MSNPEDEENLRLLVQHVSRAFYQPQYVIVMDQLARHAVLRDDDLTRLIGLQSKELNQVMAVLCNDSLVKMYFRNELKEGTLRSREMRYYYIDYAHFCNVVKWRLAQMWHIIDSSLRLPEPKDKDYVCQQCRQSYSPLEVIKLMDIATGIVTCEICHAELSEKQSLEKITDSDIRMERFNNQMRFVVEALQKCDIMVLPSLDIVAWIQNNASESRTNTPSILDESSTECEGVDVLMVTDMDEPTALLKRNIDTEVKRQQNALPIWHVKSTLPEHLSALGVNQTQTSTASLNSSAFHDGLNDVEDDEDDSLLEAEQPHFLNLSLKRPRSQDDMQNVIKIKLARRSDVDVAMEADGLNDNRDAEGGQPVEMMQEHESVAEEATVQEDDPMVYVNGTSKPCSQVMEEDHNLMTPDEYALYYEILKSRP